MTARTPLVAEQERLLDHATEAEDLDGFVDAHPTLREPEMVEALCDRATRLVRVDVQKAERVSKLSRRLADDVGRSYLRARARRAQANVQHVQGDTERAAELYEEALELFLRDGNLLEAAVTQSSALQALSYLGRHDQSEEWAEAARRVFASEGDVLRLGRLELNLGLIAFRQERFTEARELMERAYDRLLTVGDPGDVAHCLRNLATVHIALKNFDEAEEVYGRARDYCERANLPLLLGEVEYNIAYLYYLRGEYTTAIELYRATRERCEATGEVYHRALCDLDEGEMYLELNLIEETVRATEAAFRSFDELGMRYEAAKALTYLAIARIRQGKTILALGLFDQAREIFAGERNEVWLGLVDLYKAVALAREGRRFEADGLAESAIEPFEAGGVQAKVAACEALRAYLRLQGGDLTAARTLCNRALERLVDLDLPSLDYQSLYVLGKIEEQAGHSASALNAYEAAHQKLARSRSTAHAEELKVPLIEDKLEVYESLVALLAGEQRRRDAGAVFEFMEIAKSRNLVDLLAFRGLALPTRKARSAQVERVRRLREELNWYYRRLDVRELAGEEQSPESLADLRQQTRRTEDELAEGLREVAVVDPEFAELQTGTAGRLEEIRAVLDDETRLVEFYGARDTLYACVLGRDDLEVEAVSLTSRVRRLYRSLHDQLLKFRLGDEHLARFGENILQATNEILEELYAELLEPLEAHLADVGHLAIVPHGFLHWLPFHALYDGRRYLIDRFAFSYAPTATVLQRCLSAPPSDARESLLMAVPPDFQHEAKTLAAELGETQLLLGQEAKLAVLRDAGLRRRVVHLAAHAQFRGDNPMFSSIELADGNLTLFDLYSLDLDVDLVVLSGLVGGSAPLTEGDEWLGIARGLLYAGARSVLFSLWDPPAEDTGELLQRFLRHQEGGESRARALRRAMREVKDHAPHPFYWAFPALIGA